MFTKRRVVFVPTIFLYPSVGARLKRMTKSVESIVGPNLYFFNIPAFPITEHRLYTRPRNGSLAGAKRTKSLLTGKANACVPPEAFGFVWYRKTMSSISLNRSLLSMWCPLKIACMPLGMCFGFSHRSPSQSVTHKHFDCTQTPCRPHQLSPAHEPSSTAKSWSFEGIMCVSSEPVNPNACKTPFCSKLSTYLSNSATLRSLVL